MAVAGQVTGMRTQRQSHLRGWLVAGVVVLALGGATTLGARTGVLAPVLAQVEAQVSADRATGQYQQIAAQAVNHRTAEQTAIAWADTAGYGYYSGSPQTSVTLTEQAIREGVIDPKAVASMIGPQLAAYPEVWAGEPTARIVKTSSITGGIEFEVAEYLYAPSYHASGYQGGFVDVHETAHGWQVYSSRGLTNSQFNALNSRR